MTAIGSTMMTAVTRVHYPVAVMAFSKPTKPATMAMRRTTTGAGPIAALSPVVVMGSSVSTGSWVRTVLKPAMMAIRATATLAGITACRRFAAMGFGEMISMQKRTASRLATMAMGSLPTVALMIVEALVAVMVSVAWIWRIGSKVMNRAMTATTLMVISVPQTAKWMNRSLVVNRALTVRIKHSSIR